MKTKYQSDKDGFRNTEEGRSKFYNHLIPTKHMTESQEQFRQELEEQERQEYASMLEREAEQRMEEEQFYLQMLQEEPPEDLFVPSTEEELFMQIQEDERENPLN